MPRDSSSIYTQPFPDVSPGTTVASAVYNGFTHDVAIDLNAPRPIVSGGTGVTNVSDFITAFGTEVAKQAVTNYGSHDFQAGSFYSLATATGAPVTGHTFVGFCTPAVFSGDDSVGMFIEARDMDDTSVPPRVYIRQKITGVWGAWMTPATGGVDPDFSGMIFINDRHFATNDATKTYVLAPTGQFPANGSALTLSDAQNTYQSAIHSFITASGGFVERFRVTATAATCNVPFAMQAATVVAPAASDSSTAVPSTAWVRTQATDAALSTGWPLNSTGSGNYTLVLADAGKAIYHPHTDGVIRDYTIPILAWPDGTLLHFVNAGTANIRVLATSYTMYLAGTATTGTRTIAPNGFATAIKTATTTWIIGGFGLT